MRATTLYFSLLLLPLTACGGLLGGDDSNDKKDAPSDPLSGILGEKGDIAKPTKATLKAEITAPVTPPDEYAGIYTTPDHIYIWQSPGQEGAVYDLATKSWAAIPTTELLTSNAITVATPKGLFVWGQKREGSDQAAVVSGAIYNPGTKAWKAIPADGAPTARSGAVAVLVDDKKVYVLGGKGEDDSFAKTPGVFGLEASTWEAAPDIPFEGNPASFSQDRTAVAANGAIYYLEEPDLFRFDIASQAWSQSAAKLSTNNGEQLFFANETLIKAPSDISHTVEGVSSLGKDDEGSSETWQDSPNYPYLKGRKQACLAVYQNFVVFWGGHSSNSIVEGTYLKGGSHGDGWALDLVQNRWAYLPMPDGARVRGGSRCAVVGDKLAVWGGVHKSEQAFGGTDEAIKDLMLVDLTPLKALPAVTLYQKGKLTGTPIECGPGETKIQGTIGGKKIDLTSSGNYAWLQGGLRINIGKDNFVAVQFNDAVWQGGGAKGWADVQLPGSGVTGSNCLFDDPVSDVRDSDQGTFQFIVRGIRSGADQMLGCSGDILEGELKGCARGKD